MLLNFVLFINVYGAGIIKKGRVDSYVQSRISQTHKTSELEGALGIILAKALETTWSKIQISMKIYLLLLISFADLYK